MATEARGVLAATRAERTARLALLLPAFAIALVAFAWLNHINPPFPIWDDGVRDQLWARDCTELGQCHLIGAPTSLPGFHQGAVWLDLLIAVRLLGGDTATERMVVLALLALSVATLFLVVWHWLRPSMALPAAVLLTAALSVEPYASQLINPSAAAFPDVLTAAGLLCFALSARRRFLILSSFALGVAINVHVGSLSLVPPLVAIAVLARPRPWRTLLAAVGVLAATCFVTSRAALVANLLGLARHGRLGPALAGGVVLVLAAAGLGARFRRLSWDARAWAVGIMLILPFGLASLWLVFSQRHHFGITYWHPILGPAAVLAAAIVVLPFEVGARWSRLLRWLPSAACLAPVLLVALHIGSLPAVAGWSEAWTLAEADAIGAAASRRGWSFEDLVFHLQSNACRDLLAGLSVEAPPPHPAPGSALNLEAPSDQLERTIEKTPAAGPARSDQHGRRQLQVVKLRRDALPVLTQPHDVVPLESPRVAIVREIESWLQPRGIVACRRPVGSGESPVCAAAYRTDRDTLAPERFLFATRAYPEIHHLDLPAPFVASYEIPLAALAGERRELTVIDHAAPGCEWRITRVEGVQVEGQLPARHVRMHADSGGGGLLVIEKPFGTSACSANELEKRYPPCVFEAPPGDPLLAIVEAG